jgi:hypothetical protein
MRIKVGCLSRVTRRRVELPVLHRHVAVGSNRHRQRISKATLKVEPHPAARDRILLLDQSLMRCTKPISVLRAQLKGSSGRRWFLEKRSRLGIDEDLHPRRISGWLNLRAFRRMLRWGQLIFVRWGGLCPGGETRRNTEQLRVYSDSHAAPSPAMKRGQNQSQIRTHLLRSRSNAYSRRNSQEEEPLDSRMPLCPLERRRKVNSAPAMLRRQCWRRREIRASSDAGC